MRIMMISAYYPPALNGYAIQCKSTAEALQKLGHEVCVMTSTSGVPRTDNCGSIHKVLTSLPLEGYKSFRPKYILRQIKRRKVYRKNFSITEKIALDFKPQVMMVWQFDSLGFGIIHAVKTLGIPLVFNVEDYSLHAIVSELRRDPNLFWRMCRRWLYNVDIHKLNVAGLIMASEALERFYGKHGFPEKAMTVIHNAIASRHIALKPSTKGTGGKLLYVGRLHPTKGVDLAIRSLAILRSAVNHRFTLDIIGTGEREYVHKLMDLGARLDLGASLRFIGQKERKVLLELYQEYDMLLFPSVWEEPFGLTVIEAMAKGLPVVATKRGGPKNIITNMTDGILVESDDPEEFARCIQLLANDSALRDAIAQSALQTIREKFTLEKHAVRTEKFLENVVNQSRHKSALMP